MNSSYGARHWNEEDIKNLILLYPDKPNKELSTAWNRSIPSIEHKASRLNLKKSSSYLSKIQSDRSSGEKNSAWQGGRKLTPGGYVQILKKGHHEADINGYIFEHRYIMEQILGRSLTEDEVIHHKNGNKQDNRIENLQLLTKGEHKRLHQLGKRYSEEVKNKMSKAAKLRHAKKNNGLVTITK